MPDKLIKVNEIIKHLELIENVINRMAQVSFIIKGWTITLTIALLAAAMSTTNSWLGIFALASTCVFWGLDAYYLRQEKLFRKLYDKVRLGPNESSIPAFSMDTDNFQGVVRPWFQMLWNPTIMPLHGILLVLAIIVIILSEVSL